MAVKWRSRRELHEAFLNNERKINNRVEIIFGLLRAKMFTRSGKVHFFFPFLVSLIGFLQFFDI